MLGVLRCHYVCCTCLTWLELITIFSDWMRSICHRMEIRHIGDGMASLLIGTSANVLPMKRVDPPKKRKVRRDNVFLYIQGLLQGFSLTLLTLVTVVWISFCRGQRAHSPWEASFQELLDKGETLWKGGLWPTRPPQLSWDKLISRACFPRTIG